MLREKVTVAANYRHNRPKSESNSGKYLIGRQEASPDLELNTYDSVLSSSTINANSPLAVSIP
jgi:hypothetical protein